MSHAKQSDTNDLPGIVVSALFDDPSAPTHDHKWSQIAPDEAPLVRAALIRSASLSTLGVSANEAYLRGLADALEYRRQLDIVKRVVGKA